MACVFFLTFTVGDFLKGYFELGIETFSGMILGLLQAVHIADWMVSLIVD